MKVRDFDPTLGQAFQGDVAIIPLPADVAVAAIDELEPVDGRLILQEGELSGHHHAIDLRRKFYSAPEKAGDPLLATRSPKPRKAFGGGGLKAGTARLYRDPAVPAELVRRAIITRADLAIATLVVTDAPVIVSHEEHDAIRLPVGSYLIGRQVESAGAEERVVQD